MAINKNIYFNKFHFFRDACKGNYVELAEILADNSDIDIHHDNNVFIKTAFKNGNFAIGKWLYYRSITIGSPINIHIDDDYILYHTIARNNYKIIEWIFSLDNPKTFKKNKAFVYCCNNNLLEMAKWLHSYGGIDIHYKKDGVFKCNNPDILEWLYTLD